MPIWPPWISTPGTRAMASSTPMVACRAMSAAVATDTETAASSARCSSRLAVTTTGETRIGAGGSTTVTVVSSSGPAAREAISGT
jgi:hypothetical protein